MPKRGVAAKNYTVIASVIATALLSNGPVSAQSVYDEQQVEEQPSQVQADQDGFADELGQDGDGAFAPDGHGHELTPSERIALQTRAVEDIYRGPRYEALFANDADRDGLQDTRDRSSSDDPNDPNYTPVDPASDDNDVDDDGVWDGLEVNVYGTDPTVKDSDGDGLSDGEEIFTYGTDPTNMDSDGDLLTDGWEVKVAQTDPNEADSDGDGLSDWWELTNFNT